MKRRRMIVWKLQDFVASSSKNDRSFPSGSNWSTSKMVSLSGNSSSSGDLNGNNKFPTQVIPAILLGILFTTGVFFICCRRRIANENTDREASEGNNDAEGFNGELTPGLEQTVIESFPVLRFSVVKGLEAHVKRSGCAVCLSEFEEEEMVRLLPQCSHAFHPNCVDLWLCSHSTCPLCRCTLLPADDCSDMTPAWLEMIGPNSLTQGPITRDNLDDGSRSSASVGVCSSKDMRRARSERWESISTMNRASLFRTLSERYVPLVC